MCVPVFWLRQSLVDTIIEVLIMGKDDVPANIVELSYTQSIRGLCKCKLEMYKSLSSNVRGSKTSGDHVGVNEEPRNFILRN